MSTYDTWSKIGRVLMRGGLTKVEALETIDFLSQGLNGDSLPTAGARLEIDNFDEGQGSLTEKVYKELMSTKGKFTSRYIIECLQLSARKDKKNVSTILSRLCIGENPIVERWGDKAGNFRRIAEKPQQIDIATSPREPADIKLPLGLHNYVNLYSKNVVVVAGSQNAGKSAFMLNVADMNLDRHRVRYLTSEMDDELGLRLDKFDRPIEEFKEKCEWYPVESNFQDMIEPNSLNIIDFLEVHNDFYRVGEFIKQIYDKLDKGFAFIALQKDINKAHGYGGSMSLEKARLYLTINPGELTMVKVKNFADQRFNPNGKIIDFKLAQGYYFKNEGIRE